MALLRRSFGGAASLCAASAAAAASSLALLPHPASAAWDAQQERCKAGYAGRCVEVTPPYAEAALWALNLVPTDCDSQSDSCRWANLPATWRYIWNNLRLAVESAEQSHKGQLPADFHEQIKQIHDFITQLMNNLGLWYGNWHQAGASARQTLEALQPWLAPGAYRPGLPMLVPASNHGVRFPTLGRSLLVSSDADLSTRAPLANGVEMPVLGFGVWQLPVEGGVTYQTVRWALEEGYRHIDTAQGYRNEREVGRAMADSGIAREEIFLVTKLSNANEYRSARARFMQQLEALGVTYVDVYMLHSPGSGKEDREAAWRDLEALYDEGRIRALGVSNFDVPLLEELFGFARVKPVYIQNKYSVYQPGNADEVYAESSLMEWLGKNGVMMMGYSAIHPGHGLFLRPLEDPHILAIAKRLKRTPAQVIHRWLLQLGAAVIPRSTKRERIRENAQIFDFVLPEPEMRLLNGLASLVASTPTQRAPTWCEDVYGLARL